MLDGSRNHACPDRISENGLGRRAWLLVSTRRDFLAAMYLMERKEGGVLANEFEFAASTGVD